MYIFSCRELKLNKNKCHDCRGNSHPISQARDDDVLPTFASFLDHVVAIFLKCLMLFFSRFFLGDIL